MYQRIVLLYCHPVMIGVLLIWPHSISLSPSSPLHKWRGEEECPKSGVLE